jgi:hypothetical protein
MKRPIIDFPIKYNAPGLIFLLESAERILYETVFLAKQRFVVYLVCNQVAMGLVPFHDVITSRGTRGRGALLGSAV